MGLLPHWKAAFLYTDPATGQDVVIDLPAPLRDIRTRVVERRYVEEALDGTRSVKTIGPAHYELIGRIRFVSEHDVVLRMLRDAADSGVSLYYTEDVSDPNAAIYEAKLIWDDAAIELGMDADLGKIGRGEVTVVLRSSTPWGALFQRDVLFQYRAGWPLPTGATFTRASDGTYRDRYGVLQTAPQNVLRITWQGGRPYMLLDPAATNLLLGSCNLPASGSAWGSTSNFAVSAAASIFQGQTAWRHQNLGLVVSTGRTQSIGTFTGQPETASLIVENVDAAETALNIRDNTTSVNICIGRLTWATGEASVQQGAGTVLALKLADAGPNGGPVYRLMVTATGTAGNNRSVFVYPSGTSQNTQTAIIHHVQHEVGAVATSPIVTTTAAVTRAADVLTAPWPHAPQAMTGYLRFVERGAVAMTGASRVLLQIGTSATAPRLFIGATSTSTTYRVSFLTAASSATTVLPTAPPIGARVELLWRLYVDGSVQIEQSIDGGAPTVAARSAAIGLPTAWSGQVMRLSGVPSGGNEAPAAWRDAIVLRGAGWTMDQIRQRFGIS